MDIPAYLQIMVSKDGSDLYLATGAPPSMKAYGKLLAIGSEPLAVGAVEAMANGLMDDEQRAAFAKRPEMNLALSLPGIGRFRVNIFRQRNQVSMVIRSIKVDIPSWETLGLPPILTKLIMEKRGLLLFVGATGSGKSTSLASLIDYRNRNSSGHIITIEDPVEFIHSHRGCIVNQREVGVDTLSYEDALANTLRQAPDVILIGEIRHRETMEHAIAFAETGHLCISTLHANNANQAIERIVNFFPEERHKQVLNDVALNLRGIVSQRLIPTVDGKRAAAIEILLGTPMVQDLVRKGETGSIKEIMEKNETQGMQTFDQSLLKLWRAGRISPEEAILNADSKNNVKLKMTLSGGGSVGASSAPAPQATPQAAPATAPSAAPANGAAAAATPAGAARPNPGAAPALQRSAAPPPAATTPRPSFSGLSLALEEEPKKDEE